MFALQARRIISLSNKLIVRKLRNRKLPGPNPGLDERLTAFKKDGVKIDEDDAEEFIEGSEGTFFNVDEAYNKHMNESLGNNENLRYQIVKEKYFKESLPNFLTWSEKEQIRHLANTMPNEWTPERIAESFPVTKNVVKKLLKFPWKPATEQRIARHDESAMRNWRELNEGTLNIPETLRQHFLKFSHRTIPPLNKSSIKEDLTQEKIGEYESIIRRCATNEYVNESNDEINPKIHVNIEKAKDNSKVTLDELANKIKKRLEEGDVNLSDKIIIDSISHLPKDDVSNDNIQLQTDSHEEKNLAEFKEDPKGIQQSFVGTSYPERIRIPKNAYKRDATYKVNDCFYDYDGRFLYRVIGMTGNKS
ncbi:uncharacterized protein LOC126975459 [Leptidea sinapis]|uniref:Uncharacterized protein n=1 Tax=Leptidea sinapis TaxID=189913 RepID=A0A5E4QVQ4_9NEOP|nr:uncharacterized protein LOC126975459 [Leptidea sinapis]XP_050679332.1 uncharacterized protein LOC126975459 [Leptidea sinapis]XP_050679333.1 uncharacterized protein LOC126975459 [Leptidea sinapis]VVD02068.1 unnamed protein product [Leptidea sinapis]